MNFISKIKPYIFNVWVLSLLLTLLTVSWVGSPIRPGLDPSYKFAFNYFFQHDIQIGKDILFTFGPFGFLLAPMPLGNNIFMAVIVHLVMKFIFIYASITLYKDVRGKLSKLHWITLTLITYIVASGIGIHHLFMLTPLLFVLRYSIKANIYFIFIAAVITGIGLLVKSSIGIISLLILTSFSLYSLYMRDFKVFVVVLVTTFMTFLSVWFLLYHNLSGIYDYLYATLEFSKGNSSAMTQNPDNNWWIFTSFVLLFISYPLIQRDKLILILYGIILLSVAAMFKFAISREDHILLFETFLFDFSFIVFLATRHFTIKSAILLLAMYGMFIVFVAQTPYKDRIKPRLIRTHIPHNNPLDFIKKLDITSVHTRLEEQSKKLLKSRKIDANTTAIIGDGTVDSYPLFTTIFSINKLNWKPRPIFQSYITYTSYLDNKNSDFFNSEEGSEFIIWTGGVSMGRHYLFNDNPATIYQILNHYNIVSRSKGLLLMKRGNKNILKSEIISIGNYTWNQWIDVPQINDKHDSSFILAKTSLRRSPIQKLKKLIYKEFEVYIEYKLTDGSIIRFRLIVDTTENGIWVNPLLDSLFGYPISNQVQAIRFIHHKHDYFEENITIEWQKNHAIHPLFDIRKSEKSEKSNIQISDYKHNIKHTLDKYLDTSNILKIWGWAFLNNATIDLTDKYIVFKNAEKEFVFTTNSQIRHDITKYFKADDLSRSGFKAHINKDDLPKGIYNIYLLLLDDNGNQSMIALDIKMSVN